MADWEKLLNDLKALQAEAQLQPTKVPEERPGRLVLKTKIRIRKFADQNAFERNDPYEVTADEGNVGLNIGIQQALDLIYSSSVPYGTQAMVGVGNSSTAAVATDSGLIGSQQAWAGQDATYPSRASQTVTWQGTFGAALANFGWGEFTVVNSSAQMKSLVRKVSAQSTKISGQTWQLSVAITMS